LAVFVPVRYAKPEEASAIIGSLETYIFEVEGPATPAAAVSEAERAPTDPGAVEVPGAATETETTEPAPVEEPESAEAGRSLSHAGDTLVPPESVVQGEKFDGEETVQ